MCNYFSSPLLTDVICFCKSIQFTLSAQQGLQGKPQITSHSLQRGQPVWHKNEIRSVWNESLAYISIRSLRNYPQVHAMLFLYRGCWGELWRERQRKRKEHTSLREAQREKEREQKAISKGLIFNSLDLRSVRWFASRDKRLWTAL